MRILIATPLYPPDDGGPATYSHTLKQVFPKMGIEVYIVSFSHFRKYPKGLSHLMYFFALKREAKNCDLIYALDPVSVGFPAMYAAQKTGKPLVLKMAGDYAWEQGTQRFGVKENLDEFIKLDEEKIKQTYPKLLRLWRTERRVAKYAKIVIVPSMYLQGIVRKWNVDSSKIKLVYNSFKASLPKESKEELRKQLGMNVPTVISVGRFVPWKGFKVLMDVVAQVRKDVPDVVLEIAGSGDSSEYESYAKEKGYEEFVHFLGLIDHATLMKHIRAADCFSLNTGYEGLSHVVLESMALETPVVTTEVGGNPELFAPWSKLALAPYNDMKELHVRILLLLKDKRSAQNTAKSASLFVSSFTEERMAEETKNVLSSVVQ